MDTKDWWLISADDDANDEMAAAVEKPPLFDFHFEFKLGRVQHPLPDWLLSTKITRAKLGKPLPVAGQELSLLFTLPLEIRLQIYDFLLRPLHTMDFGVRMTRSPVHPRLPTILSILLTCRRALYEAEHIFYTSNRLWVDDVGFPQSLGTVRRSAVWELAVPAQSATMVLELLKILQVLPNLRSLHLVRQVSIRYIDVLSWSILASQLVTQAEKLAQIEDLKIITPEATELTPGDIERKGKLESIDCRLRQAVHHGMI